MWIFLTAVFLVLVFLFYRHPKIMLKSAGAAFLVLVSIGWGAYRYYQHQADQSTQIDQKPWQLSKEEEERQQQQAEQERQRVAEQERQRQEAEAEQARQVAEFEARRMAAIRNVDVMATDAKCMYPLLGCGTYRLTITLANKSNETISVVSLGWVFLPQGQSVCPTAIQTKRTEQVVLRPRDTTVFNFDDYDGPVDGGLSYCVKVTDVHINR
jgi:hypothetical protein